MAHLERLGAHHAPALLRFEEDNRDYFARSIPDRGDDYFTEFAARHAALLAEQATGQCHFHVLMEESTEAVLGRFNLMDVADGSAQHGYRVAERATGQGAATRAVRELCDLARNEYHLQRLAAKATLDNPASRAVLKRTGFVEVDTIELNGRPAMTYALELTPGP
jgi:ribosomal-protein-alanine N-acetyltransferase